MSRLKNEKVESDENWKTYQQNTERAIYPAALVNIQNLNSSS